MSSERLDRMVDVSVSLATRVRFTELVSTGQWEAAARRLYCHRHTLRYRIRKIEELTGRDLTSARDRIEFWLALRGRELVTNQ
jgi:sugar diacid utilization regulator